MASSIGNLNPFYTNPASKAQEYMDKIPGTITPYYNPYIGAGKRSLGTLMEQYNKLISDPSAMLKMGTESYQKSPGYDYGYNSGMNAINNAAAAGGTLGTSGHQEQAGKFATDFANQDLWNYISHFLDIYKTGLTGEEGINKMGYEASNDLASSLAANLNNQGGMAYNAQANENQSNADLFHTILSGLPTLLGGPKSWS